MPDITNQQVLDTLILAVQQAKTELTEKMASKDDLQQVKSELTEQMATKDNLSQVKQELAVHMATKIDLQQLESNLSRKLKASHTANIHHHLETRAMVGDLSHKFTSLTEGFAQATANI